MLIHKIESLNPDVLFTTTIDGNPWTVGGDGFMVCGVPQASEHPEYGHAMHGALERYQEYVTWPVPGDAMWIHTPAIQAWTLGTSSPDKVGVICGVPIDVSRLCRLVFGFFSVKIWRCVPYGVPSIGVAVPGAFHALLAGVKEDAHRTLLPFSFMNQQGLASWASEVRDGVV